MPSSISSSNDRLPIGPWVRTWALALVLATGALGAAEWTWRARGFQPSVVDDQVAWSIERQRAANGQTNVVAALGMSRIQIGFSPDTFGREFPHYRLTNLSVDGQPPVAALRDLAEDPAFRGIVICETNPEGLFRSNWDAQASYVEFYHRRYTLNKKLNRLMATGLQSHLALINSNLNLRDVLIGLATGAVPRPLYWRTRPDRFRVADYSKADLDKLHARQRLFIAGAASTPGPTEAQWLADVAEIQSWVQRIESRGGKVAFVTYPNTTPAAERRPAPALCDYWALLAAHTTAVTLRCQDLPALAGFTCPDWSHLDYRDTPAFTRGLTDELVRRGVLQRPTR